MNGNNTVFVVDDDESVRDAISMLLDVAGFAVAAFSRADDFLGICTAETQGCIILDVNMPGMDGPALQEELSQRGLRLPIIFLSGHASIPLTVRTIKSGAIDFLTKPVEGAVLLERVKEALEQCCLMQEEEKTTHSVSMRLAKLSKREREVMSLVVEGKTCKEIAQLLGLSHRTVEVFRAHVMQKTGASNAVELARIALGL